MTLLVPHYITKTQYEIYYGSLVIVPEAIPNPFAVAKVVYVKVGLLELTPQEPFELAGIWIVFLEMNVEPAHKTPVFRGIAKRKVIFGWW